MNRQDGVHHHGIPTPQIKDTKEKAFQRAICNGLESQLGNGDSIRWIDFELPVGNNRQSRDNCIDLIGEDSSGNYVLCELKFSGKTGVGHGTPYDAGEQVKKYADSLINNAEFFGYHKNVKEDFDVERFRARPPRLIVAADERYWGIHKQKQKSGIRLFLNVEYFSVPITFDEFVAQKGENETYCPWLPDIAYCWKRIG